MARHKIALVGGECVACGNCVDACPAGALSVYEGLYAKVDGNLCVGCGKCVFRCPADVIDIVMREEADE